jgi:hypothetical protein
MSENTLDMRLAAEWQDVVLAAPVPPAQEIVMQASPEQASRSAIIAELEDVRLTVKELAGLVDESKARRLATRRWKVRDVVAHLASWARRTRIETERLIAREPFDEIIDFGTSGPHVWNQQQVDQRRQQSVADLVAEIEQEHERLIDLVASLPDREVRRGVDLPRTIGEPPVPWHMPLGSMIVMSCWHARLHLGRLDPLVRAPRGDVMPTVRFTENIQRHVACPTREVAGTTVREVLDGYFRENERARGYVLDDQGRLRAHMAVFIDGRQIRDRDRLSDAVPGDAVVDLVQALSGG